MSAYIGKIRQDWKADILKLDARIARIEAGYRFLAPGQDSQKVSAIWLAILKSRRSELVTLLAEFPRTG